VLSEVFDPVAPTYTLFTPSKFTGLYCALPVGAAFMASDTLVTAN